MFQLKDLLTDAKIIIYSDCDPTLMSSGAIDTIKQLTEGEPMRVEIKNGSSFVISEDFTVVITNNRNL